MHRFSRARVYVRNGSHVHMCTGTDAHLHMCIRMCAGHSDAVSFLVEHGANVNSEDRCLGNMPLRDVSLSLSLSLSFSYSLSLSLSHSLTHTHSLSLSHSLTLSHTHTLSLSSVSLHACTHCMDTNRWGNTPLRDASAKGNNISLAYDSLLTTFYLTGGATHRCATPRPRAVNAPARSSASLRS